jgi:hypothetical protein
LFLKAQCDSVHYEMLDLLNDRIYSIIKLKSLLLYGKESVDMSSLTIKSLLNKNKGIFSELLAKHVVINEIPAELLSIIDQQNDEDNNQDNDTNDETKQIQTDEIKNEEDQKIEDQNLKLTQLLEQNENYKQFYGEK